MHTSVANHWSHDLEFWKIIESQWERYDSVSVLNMFQRNNFVELWDNYCRIVAFKDEGYTDQKILVPLIQMFIFKSWKESLHSECFLALWRIIVFSFDFIQKIFFNL